MKLCFATNNRHKLEEVNAILKGTFQLVTLQDIGCADELPETQGTIEGNARQKAEYVWQHFGVPCFADDSGLEVHALNGAPGVDSAIYAGQQRSHSDNTNLLLANLSGINERTARFKTVIHLILPQGSWSFEGLLPGSILLSPRGSGGFGYDPVFLPDGFSVSLAEMTMEEKNKISHRARAVGRLTDFLKNHSS